ncbi:MAG: T9SS type A sorting domain-containing protein, partial [Ignavibacteria bacterium]
VTGYSRSSNSAISEDYATLKYTQNGTQTWVTRYDGNNHDRAYAIVVDNSNSFYVTGLSRHNSLQGSEDYITIKYADDEVVVLSGEIGVPSKFRVYQNYPNPFNPATTIRLDISENAMVRFAVYDVLGNEKELLINGNMKPGSYNVSWDAGSYTSGIYFYKVVMNDKIVTGKMILVK